ncbi:unnamed protein product, partial [Phaeothamnion confervicola]
RPSPFPSHRFHGQDVRRTLSVHSLGMTGSAPGGLVLYLDEVEKETVSPPPRRGHQNQSNGHVHNDNEESRGTDYQLHERRKEEAASSSGIHTAGTSAPAQQRRWVWDEWDPNEDDGTEESGWDTGPTTQQRVSKISPAGAELAPISHVGGRRNHSVQTRHSAAENAALRSEGQGAAQFTWSEELPPPHYTLRPAGNTPAGSFSWHASGRARGHRDDDGGGTSSRDGRGSRSSFHHAGAASWHGSCTTDGGDNRGGGDDIREAVFGGQAPSTERDTFAGFEGPVAAHKGRAEELRVLVRKGRAEVRELKLALAKARAATEARRDKLTRKWAARAEHGEEEHAAAAERQRGFAAEIETDVAALTAKCAVLERQVAKLAASREATVAATTADGVRRLRQARESWQ